MAITGQKLVRGQEFETQSASGIGGNSVVFVEGALVQKTGGFIVLATASGKIEGMVNGAATMASDNQTVAKVRVSYTMGQEDTLFMLRCTSASLAQADEGKYFNLDGATNQQVDYATAGTVRSVVDTSDSGSATDPVINKQVRLEKYVGQNTSLYSLVQ